MKVTVLHGYCLMGVASPVFTVTTSWSIIESTLHTDVNKVHLFFQHVDETPSLNTVKTKKNEEMKISMNICPDRQQISNQTHVTQLGYITTVTFKLHYFLLLHNLKRYNVSPVTFK